MSPRTGFARSILAALMLLIAMPGARSQPDAALPVLARPLMVSQTLSTNRQNVTRLFARLEEAEGIAHIRRLLATNVEEQWAYLPDLLLWIEVGIAEAPAQVETEIGYLSALLTASGRVHLYHFHPAAYFEPGMNPTLALALPQPQRRCEFRRDREAAAPDRAAGRTPEFRRQPLRRRRVSADAARPPAHVR